MLWIILEFFILKSYYVIYSPNGTTKKEAKNHFLRQEEEQQYIEKLWQDNYTAVKISLIRYLSHH